MKARWLEREYQLGRISCVYSDYVIEVTWLIPNLRTLSQLADAAEAGFEAMGPNALYPLGEKLG